MMLTALFSKVKSYLGLETESRKRRISDSEDLHLSKRSCIERPFALRNHAAIMNSAYTSGNSRSDERHRNLPLDDTSSVELSWEKKKQGKENHFHWRMLGKDVEENEVVELDREDQVWKDSKTTGRCSGFSERYTEEVHLDDENDEVVFLKESSATDGEIFPSKMHSRLTSGRRLPPNGLSSTPNDSKRFFRDPLPMKSEGAPFGLMKYNFGAVGIGNKREKSQPVSRFDSLSVRNRVRTGNLSRAAILKQKLPPPPKYYGDDLQMPPKWSLWEDRVKKKPSALDMSAKMDERKAYCQMLQQFTRDNMSSSKFLSSPLDTPVYKMFESQLKRNFTFNKLLNQKTEAAPKQTPGIILVDCTKDDDEVQVLEVSSLPSESQKKPSFLSRDAQDASGAVHKSLKIDVQHSREVRPKFSGETTMNAPVRDRCTNAVEQLIKKSPIADEEFISDLLSRYSIKGGRINKEVEREKMKKQLWTERRQSMEEAMEEKLKRYLKITDVSFDEVIMPEKEEKLPELTSEMLDTVHNALRKNRTCVLARSGSNAITGADIQTLADSNWLNDEVINNYMDMLIQRGQSAEYPSIYAFNTFFYPRLSSSGYSSVKRWTKKVDLFAKDMVLIPLHLEIHWALAVIDFRQKTICYYDSMNGRKNNILQLMLNYLQEERMDKKREKFDTSGWQLKLVQDIPQQRNGFDCGVFACIFAEHLARGLVKDEIKKTSTSKCRSSYPPFPFSQDNMPYFRKRMIYEILTGKLLQ